MMPRDNRSGSGVRQPPVGNCKPARLAIIPCRQKRKPTMEDRIRIKEVKILSDNWSILKKTTLDIRRNDGSWQTITRETYDRGNGATILLFNREQKTVLLTRQFRFPAFVNGCEDGMLIEACAGLLENDDPESAIRRETEEETGFRLGPVTKLFAAYMSPGSVTEKVHFFAASYSSRSKRKATGAECSIMAKKLSLWSSS